MPQALSSLRTVQLIVYLEYEVMHEGEFRFDQLLNHIDSARVIAIGEDATRLVARVDYDAETNRLVGFVLPVGKDGFPIIHTYIAISFKCFEESFKNSQISKYAFVYMAQPLSFGVPTFPLACIGIDKKFQMFYQNNGCILQLRGVMVLSFWADGDSRELKNMHYQQNCLLLLPQMI